MNDIYLINHDQDNGETLMHGIITEYMVLHISTDVILNFTQRTHIQYTIFAIVLKHIICNVFDATLSLYPNWAG